jgi:ankyrin repeat protein
VTTSHTVAVVAGGRREPHRSDGRGATRRPSHRIRPEAGVDTHDQDGWTPLHLAAFHGAADEVAALLATGASPHALSRNALANTPLHAAIAGAGDDRVVRALLAGGAAAGIRAALGVTPLHLAAARGNRALCELLLAHGADPAAAMEDGKRAADIAAERGHAAVAAWLAAPAAT